MALRARAWMRDRATKIWHRSRILEENGHDRIEIRCQLKGAEFDRAATMPGAGAQICRDCMNAEEFDDDRVPA